MDVPLVSRIDIDLDLLASNYHTVRRFVAPSLVMAAVKTNAYSHGAVAIARALVEAGCRHLAVAKLVEAVELREAGITQEQADIVIMAALLPEEIDLAVEIDASVFISDLDRLEYLKRQASGRPRPAKFHIKVDTGLGRTGFMPWDAQAVSRAIRHLGNCTLEGIGTHLSAAREDDEQSLRQLQRFEEFLSEIHPPEECLIHMANSAAVLKFPAMIKTAVRVGYLLLGLVVVENPPISLSPILSYRTRVIQVKHIPIGWHVGYGTRQYVKSPIRTATIAIGTGDGLMTTQIDRAFLLVNGIPCRLLGAGSDMAMIDITGAGVVKPGDEVVYIGGQGNRAVSALEQRTAAGVGVAELLTSLRVPRLYIRGGRVVGRMSQFGAEGIARI